MPTKRYLFDNNEYPFKMLYNFSLKLNRIFKKKSEKSIVSSNLNITKETKNLDRHRSIIVYFILLSIVAHSMEDVYYKWDVDIVVDDFS